MTPNPLITRSCTAGSVGLAAAALSLATAFPASSASTASSVVSWSMNERSGTTMAPRNGHGPSGSIGAGVILGAASSNGTAYSFSAPAPASAVRADRLVTVPNGAGVPYLNPGSAPITVAISVRTTGRGEYNVIQKGQARTPGGFYKMEINSNGGRPGRPSCTFGTGSRGVSVVAAGRVNDGGWHRVYCTKRTSAAGGVAVTITVDSVAKTRSTSMANFAISNSLPLSIGGKSSCDGSGVDCDYYEGILDEPSITIG